MKIKISRKLAKALENCSNVSTLSLVKYNIKDNEILVLSDLLNKNTTLKAVNLEDNHIQENAGILFQSLAGNANSAVKSLVLNFNFIGDAGAKTLAAVLNNTVLKSLALKKNCIGFSGAKALAIALKSNTTLRKIDLRDNKIGRDGAKYFIDMLASNMTLTSVEIDAEYLREADALQMNTLLVRNQSVQACQSALTRINRLLNQMPESEGLYHQWMTRMQDAFAYAEENLGHLAVYPVPHQEHKQQFDSAVIRLHILQGDLLQALAHFNKNPVIDELTCYHLGSALFAAKPFGSISSALKTKASIAVLMADFSSEATQRLLFQAVLKLFHSKPPLSVQQKGSYQTLLGVDTLVPLAYIQTLIHSLTLQAELMPKHDCAPWNLIASQAHLLPPPELYRLCQINPLKQHLVNTYGTCKILAFESVVEHQACFPLDKKAIAQLVLIEDRVFIAKLATRLGTSLSDRPSITMYSEQIVAMHLEALSTDIKKVVQDAYNQYRLFYLSLDKQPLFFAKTPKNARGALGFFSAFKHGPSDIAGALQLKHRVNNAQTYNDITSIVNQYLNDKDTAYHLNSFASFLLDRLQTLVHSPWSTIQANEDGEYDKEALSHSF